MTPPQRTERAITHVRIWSTETEEYHNELFGSVSDAWDRIGEFACDADACSSEWEVDDVAAGITHSLERIENDDGEFENYEKCERTLDRDLGALFYLIEKKYVGPNGRKPVQVVISLNPGITEPGGQYLTEGWLGTKNDWQRTAIDTCSNLLDAINMAGSACGSSNVDVEHDPDSGEGIMIMTETIEDEDVAA